MNPATLRAAERLRAAISDASRDLIERETVVELMVLAAVAGEHVLIVGPPGTAKSAAARKTAARLGGRYFEYLLGRFTEPNELFGPIDLKKLQEGRIETHTSGMLPEAEVVFLDEVFRGSTAILNTLLAVLNERVYRRGHTVVECPIRVCVGATNTLPTEPALAAFADRFLVTLFVDRTPDHRLEELLRAGWDVDRSTPLSGDELPAIDALRDAAGTVSLEAARAPLAAAIRTLRGAGITLSDRRIVRLQKLVAAAALLDGRQAADGRDLWPIVFTVQTQAQQTVARETLRVMLDASRNAALEHAAERASLSPAARAERLGRRAKRLIDASAADPTAERTAIEGVLREIDAVFLPDELPPTLAAVRQTLVSILERTVGQP